MGLDQMIEALTRPIRSGAEGESVELTFKEAAEIGSRFGLPDRDTVVDEARDIRGAHIMPLIQPVLQRLLVELKQTLRFGLKDMATTDLELIVTGPGASWTGIETLLGDSLETEFDVDAEARSCDPAVIGGPGSELHLVLSTWSRAQISLTPDTTLTRQATGRFQTGLIVGTILALMLIAGNAVWVRHQLSRSKVQLNEASYRQRQSEAMKQKRDQFMAAQDALKKLKEMITGSVDFSVDFTAVLHELSLVDQPNIDLTVIDAHCKDPSIGEINQPIAGSIRLDGYVRGARADIDLHQYVERLKESPMFSSVQLGQIKSRVVRGQPVRWFTLEIQAPPAPRLAQDLLTLHTEAQP